MQQYNFMFIYEVDKQMHLEMIRIVDTSIGSGDKVVIKDSIELSDEMMGDYEIPVEYILEMGSLSEE